MSGCKISYFKVIFLHPFVCLKITVSEPGWTRSVN